MKRWWANLAKDYLTFTKKERIAIFLLLIIGVAIYFIPQFLTRSKKPLDNNGFNHDLTKLKITIDSSKQYKNYNKYKNNYDEFSDEAPRRFYPSNNKAPKGELFEFDPNTLDAHGWQRLGVRERTAETIQKLVSKGFKFKQPEDIKKIYGLHEDEVNRLLPYVRIKATAAPVYGSTNPAYTASTFPNTKKTFAAPKIIDINSADTSAFISLPGIGSKLAARIVTFREKLGGFISVQQVAETYGVPDSTFQKIKPLLRCDHPTVKAIDINAADANELKTNPYIKWNVANAIVNYRKQHGSFKSLEELKKIDILTEELFNKIAPYLKVSG